MKVSLKKAFSILDGRLSTEIGDVYEMLNYIYSDSLYTHQIPTAMRLLKKENPKWFADGVEVINGIKKKVGDDFGTLMYYIDNHHSKALVELGKLDNKISFFE